MLIIMHFYPLLICIVLENAELASRGLRPVYTAIMLVTHLPLAAVVVGAYALIRRLLKKDGE